MSAMNNMVADILKKALGEELIALLTAENIKLVSDKINAFLLDHKEQIDRIEAKLDTVLDKLSEKDVEPQLEGIENVNSNDSDTGSGDTKPRSGRRSKPVTND